MELYRLKEEYEQLHVQLHTVITEVEALLEEADIPNEPQALELEEQVEALLEEADIPNEPQALELEEQVEALLEEADIPNEPQALELEEQVEALLEEADIPNEPQALEGLGKQKDTREKLIIQMENVKRKMKTEQEQKKEERKNEIKEAKKIMFQIQGKAANVLEKANKVENNLKTLLEQIKSGPLFDAELKQLKGQLKEKLDKKKIFELIIKQLTKRNAKKNFTI